MMYVKLRIFLNYIDLETNFSCFILENINSPFVLFLVSLNNKHKHEDVKGILFDKNEIFQIAFKG